MKKILKIGAISIVSLILLTILLFVVSPKPTALLIHKLFEKGVAVKPDNYDEIERMTKVYTDISYESNYKEGYLDIITPKEFEGELPVIFWVHGGAFLGGDKADVTEYAVQISSKGYIVVNMNYELAPGATYPTPLHQVNEVYTFIKSEAKNYGIDMEQIYFAGDSAGAQIASQFVNIQVDKSYAKLVDIKGVVPPETIKAALLFCGPYDVTRFGEISDNFLISFIFKRVGWAYIDDKNWLESDSANHASIIEHISGNFPRTFLTDGNVGSFEDQGMELQRKLEKIGVPVQAVFYSKEEAELGHEYQFIMNTPQAENTYDEMIRFLQSTSDTENK
ncbi:alpha/beta hydrolase [Psychrobacillus sp.]|uniref:alpha/beta hydrolase n=1 Tax=Psychrobacillus sp. TaxID=1871623 RepID=UPI0028BE3EAA|nr:alpha/beta hydrolase [Psychrobacillus sp.]